MRWSRVWGVLNRSERDVGWIDQMRWVQAMRGGGGLNRWEEEVGWIDERRRWAESMRGGGVGMNWSESMSGDELIRKDEWGWIDQKGWVGMNWSEDDLTRGWNGLLLGKVCVHLPKLIRRRADGPEIESVFRGTSWSKLERPLTSMVKFSKYSQKLILIIRVLDPISVKGRQIRIFFLIQSQA
jgi:hypothetical protein